jgi:EAL domain-containing protein (putative c-di-GMP-specific phosphodiesterase class I)
MTTDRQSRITLRSIVKLVAGFPISTVADCVETAGVARRLRSIGLDYGLGEAYGRPRPLSDVLRAL